MSNNRVSLSFTELPDVGLIAFAQNVKTQMTGNENFSTPVIPMPSLTSAITATVNAVADAANGGKMQTAAKNAAVLFLLSCLRQLAAYVQSLAGENLEMLLSSGFEATSTNRTQVALPPVVIKSVLPFMSGTFKIAVQRQPTARSYELRYKNGTGDYLQGGVFTKSRGIILPGLVPGSVYTVQLRAVGGSMNYSDWSSPVSQMAM